MNNLTKLVLISLIQTAVFQGHAAAVFAEQPTPHNAITSTALDAALKAHGGLTTWQSYSRMDYTTTDFPLGANAPFDFSQTTDLRNRHHFTQGKNFTAGKNQHNAWAFPNNDALGLPPAFFESGNFYFIAMPFVFADPGVITQDLGQTTFQNKTYNLVSVTYPEGLGDTPEDDYILYIDAQTHRLKMIDFIPTSAEVNGDTPIQDLPRKALVFDNWKRYDGLLIPTKATFYDWADGQFQNEGNTYSIHDVNFSKTPPKPSLFTAQHSRVIQGTAHAE